MGTDPQDLDDLAAEDAAAVKGGEHRYPPPKDPTPDPSVVGAVPPDLDDGGPAG